MKKEYIFKINNLELHSCDKYLLDDGEHITAEVVQYTESGYSYTIAFWKRDSEGYNIVFVGSRPFDDEVNWQSLQILLMEGQRYLDIKYNEEDECENL